MILLELKISSLTLSGSHTSSPTLLQRRTAITTTTVAEVEVVTAPKVTTVLSQGTGIITWVEVGISLRGITVVVLTTAEVDHGVMIGKGNHTVLILRRVTLVRHTNIIPIPILLLKNFRNTSVGKSEEKDLI